MSRMLTMIIFLLLLSINLCSKKNEETKENFPKICCESFGYGSQMKKCCESYEMVPSEQCKVPPKFVGGGKQQVDISFCK